MVFVYEILKYILLEYLFGNKWFQKEATNQKKTEKLQL